MFLYWEICLVIITITKFSNLIGLSSVLISPFIGECNRTLQVMPQKYYSLIIQYAPLHALGMAFLPLLAKKLVLFCALIIKKVKIITNFVSHDFIGNRTS